MDWRFLVQRCLVSSTRPPLLPLGVAGSSSLTLEQENDSHPFQKLDLDQR